MNDLSFSTHAQRAAVFGYQTLGLNTLEFLKASFDEFGARLAVVSSFGAESAVLLHLVAQVNKDAEVLFLDTGKLFGETKRYREMLINTLGLTNVRTIRPDEAEIKQTDPKGNLWASNPNLCCFHRKVVPLQTVLNGYDVWISGRKRYQSAERAELPRVEVQDGRIKLNPLAGWSKEDVAGYLAGHDLPEHPLVADGYLSIGCMPCTDRVDEGEDERAGRWRGRSKSECGIHLSLSQARSVSGAAAA